MMKTIKSTFPPTVFLTVAIILLSEADVHVVGYNELHQIAIYLKLIPKDIINEITNLPSNDNDSIQYFLYTPSNPKVACYIEPDPAVFDHCPFNSSYGTKFLLPGFNSSVSAGDVFEEIKNKLLEYDNYNVIIANYAAYTYPPYSLAVFNVHLVGPKVADMIKFLINHAGVNAEDVHLIGHSLGSHLAGAAGRNVPNLGRITGLDPGGPGFQFNPTDLRSTDANFVDVIHTSNWLTGVGLGLYRAIGDIDFYPNGGQIQPGCKFGDTYPERDRSTQKGAESVGFNIFEEARPYVLDSPKDIVTDIIHRPSNNLDSIQYFLYTPSNPTNACYIEPNPEDLDCCPVNPSYETKILIPGFDTGVNPGNVFDEIKDKLLDFDKYNVIILNWTKYSSPPYSLAVFNLHDVSVKVAEMINFLMDYAGVNPQDVHLIGHSLGCQLAGVIGNKVKNLGRITALDPSGPIFNTISVDVRPSYANFVDVIHTSYILSGYGLGIEKSLGDVDFYVNGGEFQPGCEFGNTFLELARTNRTVNSLVERSFCNHVRSTDLFLYSIENCKYLATMCSSYEKYEQGQCSSWFHPTNRMGLHARKIPGLKPYAKFYLDTVSSAPFCEPK